MWINPDPNYGISCELIAVNTTQKDDSELVAQMRKYGYDTAVFTDGVELYAQTLTLGGKPLSPIHLGTGDVQEIYEILKNELVEHEVSQVIDDICRFDSADKTLLLNGDKVDLATIINVIEQLQFKTDNRENA